MTDGSGVSPPSVVSLIVCDQILDDRLSNKKSAIGLFNTILVSTLPVRVPPISVMAAVTSIRGRVDLELRLVRDADDLVVLSTSGAIEAASPLATVDLVFTLQNIQFPTAGQYAFEILAGAALLSRRKLHIVHKLPEQPRDSAGE